MQVDDVFQILLGTGAIIGGIGYSIAQYRKGAVEGESGLIKLLKEQNEAYKTFIAEKLKEIDHLRLEMKGLATQNKTYLEILQGRDAATLEFQKAGYATMASSAEILKIATQTNKNVEKLYQLLLNHFQIVDEVQTEELTGE